MRITLDQDQWDVGDDQLISEALMQVSDRAHAQHRLVTSLRLGGRPITDRDLQPMLLGKRLKDVGPIDACSQNIPEIMAGAAPAIARFASTLTVEAQGFIAPLRMSGVIPSALDRWFGQLADYMELLQAAERGGQVCGGSPGLVLLGSGASGCSVRSRSGSPGGYSGIRGPSLFGFPMSLLVEYCRLSTTMPVLCSTPTNPLKCGRVGTDKGCTIREPRRYACYWRGLGSQTIPARMPR